MAKNDKSYEYNYDEDNFYDTYKTEDAKPTSDTKDCNGAELFDGDSVQVNKDLKIKGMSKTLKQGTVIKRITTINDPDNVECKIGKSVIVLKTCFLKKA